MSMVETFFAAMVFYAAMLLPGAGENPRIGTTSMDPNLAILGTFILAWVASVKSYRRTWSWEFRDGVVFLLVGVFAIWMFCGGSDHEGYYRYFRNTWRDFGLAILMITVPMAVGIVCGMVHYAFTRKKS